MPFLSLRLLIIPVLTALLLACGDEPDDPNSGIEITPILPAATESGSASTPAPGEALTPIPGVAVDMETARRYEAEGDIEAAAAAFVAIAAAKTPDSPVAILDASRLLMVLDRYEDARLLLEPFVDANATNTAAVYLLGRAYAGLEMWRESIEQFDAYIAAAAPAAPYAYLDRSYSLLEMERPLEAVQSVQAGLTAGVPASLERTYLLAIAQSYERAGRFVDAIAAYRTLMTESPLSGDDAVALERIVALKQLVQDPAYRDDLMTLLGNYPSTFQAKSALDTALATGESIPPMVVGLVYYRHNEYTLAEPEFQFQVDTAPQNPETALAYYYLGAIRESRGDLEAALSNYTFVDILNGASPLADDALWWRARIHENEGQLDDAGRIYGRIVNEYPQSAFAPDAAFRRGMLPYRAGSFAQAASIWASDLATATDPADRQRLLLWQGKAHLKAQQEAAALPILDNLAGVNEDDYFGVRARGLRDGAHEHFEAAPDAQADLTPEWDWTGAEQWLATHTGLPATSKPWQSDARWGRAQELWRIGRTDYGDLEIYAMIDAYGPDAAAMYTLSRQLLAEGRAGMSARAGQRLLRTLDANPNEGLPRALMSLSYPAAFGPLVERYAEAESISPLLMLAFIRQESFFDPRAVSPAGALGLTQVLPETAQALATELGVTAEVPDDQLLHADLNLRLGARYMADQLSRFDNEVFPALAAYNAGGSAAERWRTEAGADADLYLETIEFSETRLYLEIVSENYAIYRYIYGGETEPNLPD